MLKQMIFLDLFILFMTPIDILRRRKRYIGKAEALLALATSFIISVIILSQSIIYENWTINIFNQKTGIAPLEGLMGVLFTGIGFLIVSASTSMVEHDLRSERIPIFYAMVFTLVSSLCGMVFFDNLIIVFICIELNAFIAAGIVMIKDGEENFKAGFKYLLLSIFASAFILIGIVILYRLTGTLVIPDIYNSLVTISNLALIKYSFIFIFIGIAIKSALFPFHIWLPDAHSSAQAASSAILSSLVLKGYIVLFIRLIYSTYGIANVKMFNILPIILILGVSAMIYGSIMAIMQRKLKKVIAYSSVAQVGYIFLGIGLGNPIGLIASIFHIITHAITKSCLFLCAGEIILQTGHGEIGDMKGIGKNLPITMGIFTICSLSMIGIPLLVGFSSKWLFARAIMDSSKYWIIIILSLSSLLNAIYYLPICIRAFFSVDSNNKEAIVGNVELPWKDQVPTLILGSLVLVFGIFSSPVINFISSIVEKL